MKEPSSTFIFVFLLIIAVGSLFVVCASNWYSNYTLDGVLSQIRQNGFTVTQTYAKPYNITMWETINQSKIEIHRLDAFLYAARTNGFYSVSLDFWVIPIIVWEPHYSDENPFYDIWFTNGSCLFIYSYFPSSGTGDM